jgi:hypothetical protein
MYKPAFRVFFNGNKQWVNIYVAHDPAHFKRKNQCHAYYIAAETRKQREGLFGYIYLSELNFTPMAHELVAHEIQHLIFDWVLTRKGMTISEKNEERIATMTGEISRRLWRKYERWEKAQHASKPRRTKRQASRPISQTRSRTAGYAARSR